MGLTAFQEKKDKWENLEKLEKTVMTVHMDSKAPKEKSVSLDVQVGE